MVDSIVVVVIGDAVSCDCIWVFDVGTNRACELECPVKSREETHPKSVASPHLRIFFFIRKTVVVIVVEHPVAHYGKVILNHP